MKTLCQKGVLLFGAVLAVCAFAIPSMASAASWSPLGTTRILEDTNLVTTRSAPVHSTELCESVLYDADFISPGVVLITTATYLNCVGLDTATGCTVTATGTRFPWTMTAPTTTNIQIHGVHIDVRYETRPPAGSTPCALNGLSETVTGTLTGGSWDPSATGANRRVTFNNDSGLTVHSALGSSPVLVSSTMRDLSGTWNLFD